MGKEEFGGAGWIDAMINSIHFLSRGIEERSMNSRVLLYRRVGSGWTTHWRKIDRDIRVS